MVSAVFKKTLLSFFSLGAPLVLSSWLMAQVAWPSFMPWLSDLPLVGLGAVGLTPTLVSRKLEWRGEGREWRRTSAL